MLNLVSGIGYPEKEKRGRYKPAQCRYAIYNFNFETGKLDIWLRITGENGNFAADTLLYKAAKNDGHIKDIPFSIKELQEPNKSAVYETINSVEVDRVPMNSGWVGRTEELDVLADPHIKMAAITGIGGQGKTALAAQFLRQFARGENALFDLGVWVDCREIPDSFHAKVIELLAALSNGTESVALYRDEKIEDTVKRLLHHLRSNRVLIVFDNVDPYVKADSEGATGEFKPIVDMVLNNEHNSLLLITYYL